MIEANHTIPQSHTSPYASAARSGRDEGDYGVCSLSGFSGWNFWPEVSVFIPWRRGPPNSGARRRGPWRPQLPGSERDRRHDRAAMRVTTACVSLSGFSGWNFWPEVSVFIPWRRGPPKSGARRRGPWRPQLPGSERDRRHDRAAMRVTTACALSLDFQVGIFGLRSLSLSLGEGAHRNPALGAIW